MLIRKCTQGGDYGRTLRRRENVARALWLAGMAGVVCDRMLMPGSGLPDPVRGFFSGAVTGIFIVAMVLLLRTRYLLTHPEAQRKTRVFEEE